MKKEILVSVDQDDVRVAITENDQVVELYLERPGTQRLVGNTYLGKVENVLPGMEACFVDVGMERNTFLYVDDAYPVRSEEEDALPNNVQNAAINKLVHPGQQVMVQIVKEPIGSKGARVTRNITLPGRYLVLMPAVDYVGVSRKITDDNERDRLRDMADEMRPSGCGLIVRTVAEERTKQDIKEDMDFLLQKWRKIQRKSQHSSPPALLYQDMGLSYRVLRDYLDGSVDRVIVDNKKEYDRILNLLDDMAPSYRNLVQLRRGTRTLFEERDIDREMEKTIDRKVWLDCGGYIVIDKTEALTSIDVNTGRYVGSEDLQETVFKTNLEAAEEIVRQLRLRDIGGIIIIDFIDMESRQYQKRVIKALEDALESDKTKATVLGITKLGLVEMTRKKGQQSLDEMLLKPCPYCEGEGRVMSEYTMSQKVRGEIRKSLISSSNEAILVEVHPTVASLLIGSGGSNLRRLEEQTNRSIYVRGAESCHLEEMKIVAMGDKKQVEKQALPVSEGEVMNVKVEEPHSSNPRDGIARVEGYVIDIENGGKMVGENVNVEIVNAYRTYAKACIV